MLTTDVAVGSEHAVSLVFFSVTQPSIVCAPPLESGRCRELRPSGRRCARAGQPAAVLRSAAAGESADAEPERCRDRDRRPCRPAAAATPPALIRASRSSCGGLAARSAELRNVHAADEIDDRAASVARGAPDSVGHVAHESGPGSLTARGCSRTGERVAGRCPACTIAANVPRRTNSRRSASPLMSRAPGLAHGTPTWDSPVEPHATRRAVFEDHRRSVPPVPHARWWTRASSRGTAAAPLRRRRAADHGDPESCSSDDARRARARPQRRSRPLPRRVAFAATGVREPP